MGTHHVQSTITGVCFTRSVGPRPGTGMGVCSSKNDGRKTAAAAAKTVDKSGSPVEEKLPKLLVIGSGGSGKSTLRKQFCLLYGKGYDENDRRERIPIVHYNIVASLKILCAQSLALKVEVVHPDSREFLLNWQDSGEGLLSLELLKHVQTLWKDEGIQHTYEQRHTFQRPACGASPSSARAGVRRRQLLLELL